MIVYSGIKSEFMNSVVNDTIALEVQNTIWQKMGRATPQNEFRAWENSLQYMFKVLSDEEIPSNAGIAIEYNIPQTSKRVDFIISGYNEKKESNAVIIELKQWEKIEAINSTDALVKTYVGGANRLVVHPSYQVWSYTKMIEDYNQNVQDSKITLSPCAYLHNYTKVDNDPIEAPQYKIYLDDAPAFAKGDVPKLRDFIKKCIKKGDNREILYHIDHGKIRPSKSLQNAIGRMLQGNKEFTLIDEQKVIYEQILKWAQEALKKEQKKTIIVEGGPGTGKTVLAINLLAQLTKMGQFVQYTSKNSAPRNVYLAKLKGLYTKSSIDNMFKSSGTYVEAPTNSVHTILADESHRLNAKSGLYQNLGENQIKEIINASYCNVFFIDETQRVTIDDIGSIDEIKKWANQLGSTIEHVQLQSQFRCNGSDGYLAWLDDVLEIRETANYNLDGIDYDFRILDNPEDVRTLIVERNKINNRSRILAGYCWDWKKDQNNNTNYHDIKIDSFEISWNLKNTTTYAIDPGSIKEAGCIHTSQGLEFDYVGVIIGKDIRYENGKIVTDFTQRARTDNSLKGIKSIYKKKPAQALQIADKIIKNTYKTLMTRGMKGCYVYCCDKALADYLRKRIDISNI
ncbi:DUF2075 domain-containing protein [Fibrobacter sp. UWR2]|uniref:DUF2075 domain-containing protein n=1 Tax=Fibrobacter sp. UWR2 TaxID=1964352 RepID=UPI000B5231E8|nr:DUF2075 domain-containing protein [Fibrobacter sp. UWR2]OWU99656.1 ATP-binding protein [Fibrobacter sp. UWR2]